MLHVKNQVLFSIFLFIFFLTGCGPPQASNSGFPFASISSPPVILPNPTANTIVDSKNPQIAVDPTGIYVVWENKTDSNILLSYSKNGGNSFQQPVPITGSSGGTYPRMTTDGNGNLFVIWLTNSFPPNIYLNYAISGTFQNTIPVSSSAVPSPQYQVPQGDIAYTANNLYVTWSQCSICSSTPVYDIFYQAIPLTPPLSPNSITGNNFSSPQNITHITNGSSSAFYPKIVQSGSASNILYQITNPSGLYLYNTTSATQNTVGNPSAASNAALSTDRLGNSYVSWNPNSPPHDIYLNSLKNGSVFNSNIANLSNNGNSIGPVLGIDSGQYLYVAFFSRTALNPNAFDVFLERSMDGGRTFGGVQNISNSPGDSLSYAPGMAIVGKTAYIVWDDNSATNPSGGFHQIYFQKLTLN